MENSFLRGNESNTAKGPDSTAPATTDLSGFAPDAVRNDYDRLVCRTPLSTEKISESNFSKLALAAFDIIDINKDGILEKSELKHSIKSSTELPCTSLDAARVMLKDFEVVKSFEGFDKSYSTTTDNTRPQPGISKEDLLKFEKIRAGSGLYGGYAKDSIYHVGMMTGALSAGPAVDFSAKFGTMLLGKSTAAIFTGSLAGMAAAGAIGAGAAAGYNYLLYKHEHLPKVKTFFDDINADTALRSRFFH